MKILLAIDGSRCSDGALERVALEAWPAGSEVRVVFAVRHHAPLIEGPSAPPLEYYEQVEMAERELARQAVERAAAKIRSEAEGRGGRLKLTTAIISGSPKSAIVEEAERWRANLIVVGSHGSQSWEQMLLGSVSQRIATHARCPVEIISCEAPA